MSVEADDTFNDLRTCCPRVGLSADIENDVLRLRINDTLEQEHSLYAPDFEYLCVKIMDIQYSSRVSPWPDILSSKTFF